ncbi:PREDICTED: coiled-coil domain-containing protein 112-like [Dinoponera quadriceps]|uniref:Coiled-coil domain-containing protein 112-like n=1 Tax=Dinoponera quadriceps TaxID=609295 RepID=A0A6P3XX67_DINQU|nr:PREDICTED: coiled-coil domain-containing protein 112-like [Dinoponera quadriceps]
MNGTNHDENKKEKLVISCEKICSAESTKYKNSLFKLKQQESLIENSLLNWMESMRLKSEVMQLVLRDISDISRKREILLDGVKKSLEEITEEFKSAKFIIKCPEQIQNLDTNAYKQRLIRLSQKIRDFQESCRIESLSQEQTTLESEVREFKLNLHKYENVTRNVNKPTFAASSNKNAKGSKDYKEIQDFQALIAKTGHTDNWSDEDHLLFLKMRQKCSNIPALVAAIQIKCPDLTAEIIVNHEAWYKVYLNLHEKQRTTVREWRKQKEIEKEKKIRGNEAAAENMTEISRGRSIPDITEKLPPGATNKCETKVAMPSNVVDVDSVNQKKELIRQWRMERENKRSMEEQQSKILTESKLAAQEKRKQDRLKKIRADLIDYHEKKLTELSATLSKTSGNDSRTERKCNPAMIKAFRKQDEQYARRKKNIIATLRKPAKHQTTKIARSQVTKARDYSTLLNPTKVWSERCKMQNPDAKEPRNLQYIKDVPRLYVQWRNKESMDIKNIPTYA